MSNAITKDAAATEGCAAVAGYARTCRDCAHCADIHAQTELIYCEERQKNKHPNYAAQCESFVRHTGELCEGGPQSLKPGETRTRPSQQ